MVHVRHVLSLTHKDYSTNKSTANQSRALVALGFILSVTTVQANTTVIIRRTHTEIIVAADSLMALRVTDKFGKRQIREGEACKVLRVQKRAAAFAGWTPAKHITLEDIQTFTRRSLETGATLESVQRAVSDLITEPLRKGLDALRLGDIEEYRKRTVKEGTSETIDTFNVFLVGFENGDPAVAYQYWRVTNAEGQPVRFESDSAHVNRERRITSFFGGVYSEIERYADDAEFWTQNGNINAARKLVQLMIDAHPDEVRGFTDILRITPVAACWEQIKKEGQGCTGEIADCPNPTPTPKSERAAPEETSGIGSILSGILTVVLLGVVGFGLYYALFRK